MFYIETFPVGSFQCNCSIVVNKATQEAIVVDPGDEFKFIWERLCSLKVKVKALWHTHAHIDHLGATHELLKKLSAPELLEGALAPKVYLHPEDSWLYKNIDLQAGLLGLTPFTLPEKFESIKNNQSYEGFEEVKALHTPGHTPGSCCLMIPKNSELAGSQENPYDVEAPQILLSGDTLFRRSIGRTDLWGGDFNKIKKSISEKLFTLPEETVVIPGHGPLTRIDEEIHKNPFVR